MRRLFDNERSVISSMPSAGFTCPSRGTTGGSASSPPAWTSSTSSRPGSSRISEQLRTLFDFFTEVLQQVCHEGKAYEDDVRIHIRRLRAPGGEIKDKHVLWESYGPRRDAAAALGRLGDPAAIPALASVLWDEDSRLRARAIDALAEIGHRDGIGPLIRLLGDIREAGGRANS